MDIEIKKMETEEETRGKAYVHWCAWHEAYPGLVSQEYLNKLTLEKCEKIAFDWPDNLMIAKDAGRVIGFVGYGDRGEEAPDIGEIFALYILSEYYGERRWAAIDESGPSADAGISAKLPVGSEGKQTGDPLLSEVWFRSGRGRNIQYDCCGIRDQDDPEKVSWKLLAQGE